MADKVKNKSGRSREQMPNKKGRIEHEVNLVKSPSDTTIYTPALHKMLNIVSGNSPIHCTIPTENDVINQISDFIQGIRIRSQVHAPTLTMLEGDIRNVVVGSQSPQGSPHIDAARRKADQIILQAEQHKAAVNAPPGMYASDVMVHTPVDIVNNSGLDPQGLPANYNLEEQNSGDPIIANVKVIDDDDFFHVSCHVDQGLKSRNQHGEFVELKRLLPKNRKSVTDNKMELVFRKGNLSLSQLNLKIG